MNVLHKIFLCGIVVLISSWGYAESHFRVCYFSSFHSNLFHENYADSVTRVRSCVFAEKIVPDKNPIHFTALFYNRQCKSLCCQAERETRPVTEITDSQQIPIDDFFNQVSAVSLLSSANTGNASKHFIVIPLGVSGGQLDSNLSSYLLSAKGSENWISLDAGTTCSETYKIGFSQKIKGYLLSHAHLDHIAGLVLCSPLDVNNNLYGLNTTINYLSAHIFNWNIWPNFGDEGILPLLKKYHYLRVAPGNPVKIPDTGMTLTSYPLSHGIQADGSHYPSTAFLLESEGYYFLYCGDTGADRVENSHDLKHLWKSIASLIRQKKMTAIFVEVSYANTQPDSMLYGHLSPKWLLEELHTLASQVDAVNPSQALKGLNIVITHIKFDSTHPMASGDIMEYLKKHNDLGVNFMVPIQGQKMEF